MDISWWKHWLHECSSTSSFIKDSFEKYSLEFLSEQIQLHEYSSKKNLKDSLHEYSLKLSDSRTLARALVDLYFVIISESVTSFIQYWDFDRRGEILPSDSGLLEPSGPLGRGYVGQPTTHATTTLIRLIRYHLRRSLDIPHGSQHPWCIITWRR